MEFLKHTIVEKTEDQQLIIQEQKRVIHHLTTVLDELPGSIYWKNKEGVYLGHNKFSAEKMKSINLQVETIVGKTDYDLFPQSVADQYRQHDLKVMNSAQPATYEESIRLEDGQVYVQLSCKRPLRDEQGEIIGVIGNTVDITQLKQTEAELREAKEKVENLIEAKDEMLKYMEHDIRTPFNGIWVLTNLLEEQEVDLEKKQLLKCVSESAKSLLDYCNRILEFIKTQSSKLPIIEKKFNLKSLIENVITIEQVAAKSKSLDLSFEYDTASPTVLIGDAERIQRILLNLVGNAIKYTEKGCVKIKCKMIKKIDEKRRIFRLRVEDTGIGLSKEKQDFLFEKFSNLQKGKTRISEGYGLGLPLVKNLIQDLDGEIDVKSKLEKGTHFVCTLPFRLPLIDEVIFQNEES